MLVRTGKWRGRLVAFQGAALALLLGDIVWLLAGRSGPAGPRIAAALPPLVGACLIAWQTAGVRAGRRPGRAAAAPYTPGPGPRTVPEAGAATGVESVLDHVTGDLRDAVLICNPDATVRYASPAVPRLADRTGGSWRDRELYDLLHPDDLPAVREALREACAQPGRPASREVRIPDGAGWAAARMTLTDLRRDGALSGIVVALAHTAEVPAGERDARSPDSYDSLTELAGPTLFTEQLTSILAGGGDAPAWLALIELEDLRTLGATLSPRGTDALLVQLAERLRQGVRPNDLVARLREDQFAVLLKRLHAEHLDRVAERMMNILAEPLRVDGCEVSVPAAIGFAQARAGGGADQLMRHAEIALSEARIAGDARYACYADEMAPRANARAQLIKELNGALAAEEFELYYQPIVALPGGRLVGVEALLRWRHPRRGLVPPLDFIPLAEQTGLIVPLGRWIIESACRQAATWLAQYPTTAPATISVNVSPRQLREPSVVDDVARALRASGLPPERLVVEVTETAVVDHATAGNNLGALHRLGVRISLDDFGTGHSTLSLLDTFPIDQLKLDRSFLREPGHDRIAVAVVKIAQAIGAEVVAEGVEVPSQAERLYALGYGLAQGFHFGRPSTVASMTQVLRGDMAADVVN